MKPEARHEHPGAANELNLFCVRVGEVWRVHVTPTWLPRYLHQVFDENGEAFPVLLDFDDLDEQMVAKGAAFEKRVSRIGDVELTARGAAATVLAVWLSTAFASGVRDGSRTSVADAG
jgi:hypothetical protein